MCGITAIVDRSNMPVANLLVRSLNARIAHRGPDNDGTYHGANFALGHRRLSIIDPAQTANQPFHYLDSTIVFNGEIYNHCSIRQQLQQQGYVFKTRSDTEVILAAYHYWGEQCVQQFEGMWAFVIYDAARNILFGSRDRFGQKPFYYGSFGDFFVIASEIKQFMEVPGFQPQLNQASAFNFLNYGALNYSDQTFFEGVSSLDAGHNLVYDLCTHTTTFTRWYNFPVERIQKIEIEEASAQFRQLFRKSLATRLQTDVSLGSCLSGGLDSSSIVCMARSIMNGTFHDMLTFSICWHDRQIDEQEYIDEVSTHTTARNKKIFPDINDLNRKNILDKIIYHQEQPVPSASHFAEYKVYEAAAMHGVSALLDGQGADEYLGGYDVFNWYYLHGLFTENRFSLLTYEWRAMRDAMKLSDRQMLQNFLLVKYRRVSRLYHGINERWGKEHLSRNPLEPAGGGVNFSNLCHHQLFTSSLPYQLHSADRNSMCHSVESRLPFLDHRLVEFVYSMPDSFKISSGMSKVMLRRGLNGVLPGKVRERKSKLGFPAPERRWLLDNAEWFKTELRTNAAGLEKFISIKRLEADFSRFAKTGEGDHTPFFRVISFATWLKVFNASY